MDRTDELLNYVCAGGEDKEILNQIIEEVVFLEYRLEELKKLPFIQVHPKDPAKQKTTPAAKQYKELLQQYSNLIKILSKSAGKDSDSEESPLRKWMNRHVNSGT